MEAQINCLPSIVNGNKKRPPTEYVAKLASGAFGSAFVHTIDRDPSERYKVVLTNGALKVFDMNGVEKTVSFPDGSGYLSAATPSQNFRLLTIADYTFVVNNTVQATMSASNTATRNPEALVFVKQAQSAVDYKVSVNGTTSTHHTSDNGATAESIAAALVTAIGSPSGVTMSRDRATIWFQSASTLVIKAIGPNTDIDMRGFTKTAQNFTDLPTIAPSGYHIEVVGTEGNAFDNYHVKFVTDNPSQSFDTGHWVETVAQGIQYQLDASTMPHVLIRNGDGTFTFQEADWTNRVVGDDVTNPIPSFIGNKINDVVFHKGRLGFLAESNIVLSESGKFFNFFRTTVTTLLDTDPIDIAINQVAILRSAVEFDKTLLLVTDKHHFVLSGGDLLTPKSATTDPLSKFETTGSTEPAATDKAVYFAVPKDAYAGVKEMTIDPDSGRPDPQDVTAHVSKYIPGTITKLAISPTENFMLALASGDQTTAYAYNFFFNGTQKLQSAWGKWTFNGSTILSAEFLNASLYLVLQRSDGIHLVKMVLSSSRADSAEVMHLTNLDMRLSEEQCSAIAYDEDTDRTTFTLPYPTSGAATYSVVSRFADEGNIAGSLALNVEASGSEVSCDGDMTETPVYVGENYTQEFELSEQFVTFKDAQGAEQIVPDATLKLLFLTLMFEKTGYFRVQIDYDHRPDAPHIAKFEGRVIGSGNNATDGVALEDGKLRVRVGADSARCRIRIINDSFLPANIQSASWEGREVVRTKQGA